MISQKFALVLTVAALGCGGGTDISKFNYGGDQPGVDLPEGGEIRHENVRILGMPEQTWAMVYQYKGPSFAQNAPFAEPADGGKGIYGNCVDERNGSPTWPFTAITGATYINLPKVSLTGPGIATSLDIVKTDPPNTVGNSNFRKFDFTYGGGAPGDQAGFNASQTTAAMSTQGGHYTLDIGEGTPMDYYMPEAYTAPLGIGGAADVIIPRGAPLEYSWTTPHNDKGASGFEHTKKTYFNLTFFADPTSANPPQFMCFPDTEGHQIIPQAVIDALPDGGLIVNANLSHYMEARTVDGEQRRFDLVSIYCNISLYKKQ